MNSISFGYRSHPGTMPDRWYSQSDSGTTNSAALAVITDSLTPPTSSTATGRWLITPQRPKLQLAFSLTDADNENYSFGMYFVRRFTLSTSTYYSTVQVMTGSFQAGSKACSTGFWADNITVGSSSLPSSSYAVVNNTNDVAWLEVDCREFEQVLVILTSDSAPATAAASANLYEAYASL